MHNTSHAQDKAQVAINTQLLLALTFLLIFIILTVCSAAEHRAGLAVGFAAAACVPLFVCLISPLYCVFSKQEVKIVYTLGQTEIIRWSTVRSISCMGGWIVGVGLPRYVIAYPKSKKSAFFVCGEIPKTRKTKKLIERYYK